MVFPVGVSVAERISATPVWSGGTASLLVHNWDFVRHLGHYPLGGSPRLSGQAITGLQRSGLGGDFVSDLPDTDGLGHRSKRSQRRAGCGAELGSGVRTVDFGCGRGRRACPLLAI